MALRKDSLFSSSAGSTLVEFAVVFPLLILFIIGLIETSRWLITKNILETSANRAASLAAVIPELDSIEASKRVVALDEVRSVAKDLASKTLVKEHTAVSAMAKFDPRDVSRDGITTSTTFSPVEIKLPDPTPSLEYALNDNPIQLNVYATFNSLIPFISPLKIKATRTFFRERRVYASEPIPLDCRGEKLELGVDPKCPCWSEPTNPYKRTDPETGECVCRVENNVVESGDDCVCEFGHSDVGGDGYCECTIKVADCGPGTYPDRGACICREHSCTGNFIPVFRNTAGGVITSQCRCPGHLCIDDPSTYLDSKNCVCKPCDNPKKTVAADLRHCVCVNPSVEDANCGSNERFDPVTCECVACPEGMFTNPNDPTQCTCDIATFCNSDSRVSVNSSAAGYDTGDIFRPYFTWVCSCTACTAPQIQDPKNPGMCACPQAMIDACAADQAVNATNCTCSTCSGATVRSPSDPTKCICEPNAALAELACNAESRIDTTQCKCLDCNNNLPILGKIRDPGDATKCACDVDIALEKLDCAVDYYLHTGYCQCLPCNYNLDYFKTRNPSSPSGTSASVCICDPAIAMDKFHCDVNSFLHPSYCGCFPCTNGGTTQNPADPTKCICDPALALDKLKCADGQYVYPPACKCYDCTNANVYNPSAPDTCICDIPRSSARCAENQYLDVAASCSCKSCPSGQVKNETGTGCKCPGGSVYNEISRMCECSLTKDSCSLEQYFDSEKCQCLTCDKLGTVVNADRTGCECSLSPDSCAANEYLDYDMCACTPCSGNFGRDDANECTSCLLAPTSCPANTQLDPITCACVACPQYTKRTDLSSESCQCIITQANCLPGGVPIYDECLCEVCVSPLIPSGDTCACPSSMVTTCKSQGKATATDTCECYACIPPKVVSTSGTSCVCPTVVCANGEVQDLTTCECNVCEDAALLDGGGCCSSGSVAIGGTACGPLSCCATPECLSADLASCELTGGTYTRRE